MLRAAVSIFRGVRQSRKILREFKPDLVVGFGSFYTLPMLIAATLAKIPLILHEQNAIVGKVNRFFSRFATLTAITFPESATSIRGKVVEALYPLRKKNEAINPWDYFQLDPNKRTLLVFGGSQGARALNDLFLESIEKIQAPFQVLHFAGKADCFEKAQTFYHSLNVPHTLKEFDPKIDLALQIADLAITRAGAGTIAELIDSETPAILIPFPYAAENHQVDNSNHFVDQVGGGVIHLEKELTGQKLANTINTLIQGDLNIQKERIKKYKRERAVKELSQIILETL